MLNNTSSHLVDLPNVTLLSRHRDRQSMGTFGCFIDLRLPYAPLPLRYKKLDLTCRLSVVLGAIVAGGRLNRRYTLPLPLTAAYVLARII